MLQFQSEMVLHLFLHRCHPYVTPTGLKTRVVSFFYIDVAPLGLSIHIFQLIFWALPSAVLLLGCFPKETAPTILDVHSIWRHRAVSNQQTAVKEDSQGSDCGIVVRYTDGYRFSKR